ncbi:Uma2 family endonuclease [Cyanobacterium sp. Dongsha4]|uniref:Uma2 family endonuclease n=1 Tax=Cyanobacterium sp. DS4 TaxID=2878255 RepID=UPI002E80914D|nr:Uma2 family endonuclease [Cyanobacterium sp. Dongsha4]WVL01486.1 Uma2 family endonuclease [Cyanobacterium sp. Dongsha4]
MKTLMKWSLEDYHNLINNGVLADKNVELLEGELIEMPPESPLHTYITSSGSNYLREKLKGLAFIREAHPITLSNSEPEPDIAIVKPHSHNYKNRHPFADDIFLLIEVSNKTLSYDLNEKKKTYAKEGIKEYWVVDINSRQIHVFFNPESDNYLVNKTLSKGTLKIQSFPDLELVIEQLFVW